MIFYISSKMFSYAQEAISIEVKLSIKNIDDPKQFSTSLLSILSSFLSSDEGRSHIYYYHTERNEIWRWHVVSGKIQAIDTFEIEIPAIRRRREIMYNCLQKHYLNMKPTLTLNLI